MSLIGERALTVRTWGEGQHVDGHHVDGRAAAWTLDVLVATDGETYGVDLAAPASVSHDVVAGVAATAGELGDAIADAWNGSAAAAHATAASDGAGAVTFTGVTLGADVDLVLDDNAAKMLLTQTITEIAPYVDAPFTGTWRPMPAIDVQLLESGDRRRDPRVIHTTTQLVLASQYDHRRSAWVSPDEGVTWYELIDEFDGDTAIVSPVQHWKYRALRVQEEEP